LEIRRSKLERGATIFDSLCVVASFLLTLHRLKKKRLWQIAGLLLVLLLAWYFWPPPPRAPSPPFRFADGFENVTKFADLFPHDYSRWHGRQQESAGGKDANHVELVTNLVHSGTNALRFQAGPYDGRTASKADIELGRLTFGRGDQVWFTGWYYLVGGTDAVSVFLWDLETTQYPKSPGRRLYIQSGEWLASDLGKWWIGKTLRQSKGQEVKFPKDRWVQLRVHMTLVAGNDGLLEVWQDDTKVLDARGRTLPTASSVYNRLQIGLTANGNRQSTNTLYIDDIVISNRPLW